jgi:Putative transposase/Transposase zinc-binding domain
MSPLSLPSTAPPALAHPSPPPFEVADIVRAYGAAFRTTQPVSHEQARVLRAIAQCRTAALGGHVEQCVSCGTERVCYDSCRNRHCPKCQSLARAQWLEDRQADLLNCQYFHVVFTLPEAIAAIAYQNQRLLYNLLFSLTSQTLHTIAADPKHLGAQIGFLAILHTWGQNLLYHPHLHCVVPGGGLSPDGSRWVGCRRNFFLSVRVLARLFRTLFLEQLQLAFDAGELNFFGALEPLRSAGAFTQYLAQTRPSEWVVYAKPPFGGAQQVLDYLGRYTHRVAISNNRLLRITHDSVIFRWKDYRNRRRKSVMRLSGEEFCRRFLLHVLPEGLQRIRHYGLLSNRHGHARLDRCRELLAQAPTPSRRPKPDYRDRYEQLTGRSLRRCPACRDGQMHRVHSFRPGALPRVSLSDTS